MSKEKRLLRLSLQFFGGDDDLFGYEEPYTDGDGEESEGNGDGVSPDESPTGDSNSQTSGNDGGGEGDGTQENGQSITAQAGNGSSSSPDTLGVKTPVPTGDGASGADGEAAVISELKALGLEGRTLTELAQSLKARREAEGAAALSAQRRDSLKGGKAHVKGSAPDKAGNGSGMSGFDDRDIAEIQACLGRNCDKKRAREALERRVRAERN